MKTPIRKRLQQRSPPSNSSNLLHHESKDIASESPSPTMASPANEEVEVTFPDTESSIESFEMLDSDLLVSPTTDEIVSESPSQMMASPESKVTSPDTGSSIETSEILDSDLLASPTTDENLVSSTDSSGSTSSTSYTVSSTLAKSDESQISTATEISKVIININLNFPHSASPEVIINSTANVSPNESEESEAEMMMMVDLLKRSGTDLNRLKSLLKIDDTNLKEDLSELKSGKVRIGIICLFIWIGVLLVILLRRSHCGLSDSLTPPT